jgi:triphosphoribosyl-dephospho-CoA synthetase
MVIHNCNTEKLQNQKKYLKNEIINGTNDGYFKVIDLECGTGKSLTAEEAFVEMALTTDKKALFVLERTDDCDKSVEKLNKLAKKTIARAVHSKNTTAKQFNETLSKELTKYPVVIITHEKYKELSINEKVQKIFSEGRNILVIDEFLNMAKGNELMINKEFIKSFETILFNRALRVLFAEIVAELEDYLLLSREKNTFFNANTDIKIITKKANKLKALIKTNLTKQYCKSIKYTKNELCKKIDEIKSFYRQTCVVEGNMIYCFDLDYSYWFLSNNIMLDGSGNLNKAYKLGELNKGTDKYIFQVQRQSKVLDHHKWKFYIMKTNSTTSAKKRALNFYEVVNQMLDKEGLDKTLYIGNISDEQSVEAYFKNHIGNITGSNQYMDLQNVVIGHNPNVPFRLYILEYIYFSGVKFTNRNSWDGIIVGSKDEKVYRFKEKQFEDYRQCRNANEIYQAIKRINRNMSKESKVFILNNDVQMCEIILKMFKNCTVDYFDSEVEYEKNKMDKYNEDRKENSYARRFIALCKEIIKLQATELQQDKKNRKGELIQQYGIYSKKKICEYMNLTSGNFAKYILNDVEVMDYFNRHNIKVGGQTIDFTNTTGF